MQIVSLFFRVKNEKCFLQSVPKEPTHILSVSLDQITVYVSRKPMLLDDMNIDIFSI